MKHTGSAVLITIVILLLALASCTSVNKGPDYGQMSEKPAAAATLDAKSNEPEYTVADSTQVSGETTDEAAPPAEETASSDLGETDMQKKLHMFINGTEVAVAWEDNESVNALTDLVSADGLTVQMSMYGGFEQVGSLGRSLPRNDKQTTTKSGDIVLYSGNQIVVFYGSNSWSYTRLGHITDKTAAEMSSLLGNDNVTITIAYGG